MALLKTFHCIADREDEESGKHHFPLGLHDKINKEHGASGVNSTLHSIR